MASADSLIDRIKVATFMGIDRPHVLKCLMPGATATYSLPRRYADT